MGLEQEHVEEDIIEMHEEYHEETVQMADVKWQKKQKKHSILDIQYQQEWTEDVVDTDSEISQEHMMQDQPQFEQNNANYNALVMEYKFPLETMSIELVANVKEFRLIPGVQLPILEPSSVEFYRVDFKVINLPKSNWGMFCSPYTTGNWVY